MTPCLRADGTVFDMKLIVAHSSMVDLPCPHLAVHTSTAKWTHVNKTFLCDNTVLQRKLGRIDGLFALSQCSHTHVHCTQDTRMHKLWQRQLRLEREKGYHRCGDDLLALCVRCWSHSDCTRGKRTRNFSLSALLSCYYHGILFLRCSSVRAKF